MKVAFLWVGQQILLTLLSSLHKDNNFWGKYILSGSFLTDSHIKNPSKLHKNGKPRNKKRENLSSKFCKKKFSHFLFTVSKLYSFLTANKKGDYGLEV